MKSSLPSQKTDIYIRNRTDIISPILEAKKNEK